MEQIQAKSTIDQIKAEYLIHFQNWLRNSGINPYIGRIMQLFRFENKPLTQNDIKIALQLSKATVSRNLKVMEEMNLLKKDLVNTGEKTSDKFIYELKENSLFYIIFTFLKSNHELFINRRSDNDDLVKKIADLSQDERNSSELRNLERIIKEEMIVFDIMKTKFEIMIQDMEIEMRKLRNQ